MQGPPLHLREAWQVEVVGSKIVRAGLMGAVKWAAPEAKALAGSTPFKLQVRAACAVNCHACGWHVALWHEWDSVGSNGKAVHVYA